MQERERLSCKLFGEEDEGIQVLGRKVVKYQKKHTGGQQRHYSSKKAGLRPKQTSTLGNTRRIAYRKRSEKNMKSEWRGESVALTGRSTI